MSFSFGVVNVVGVEVFGDSLSHGGPVEVDPVRVVDDTVEDGVGECRFADDVVPFVDGQLAGDQDGGVLVSVLDDFHEVGSLIGAEAVGSPIVEDEEIGLGESTEQAGVASVGAPCFELGEHPGNALVENGEVVAAGLLAERTGAP